MTTVTPTTTTPASTASATQNAASQQLAGNFNTFLTLLTTQLQNQDPTSPMDSNAFTQQLVEFSQVEQQINTNNNLQTLISLGQGRSNTDAVSYLGKAVTISNGEGVLQNGAATWNYSLGTDAVNTTLSISNASGQVVYQGTGETASGVHTFDWNGQDNSGNQLPDGAYKMTITSTAADGSTVQTQVASGGVVSEVDLSGSQPMLVIGPMEIPISAVSSIGNLSSN
ncbi:MAG TPA: flagellar hook capping FlgD N-terminal domain-containing protein [Rhizomicrobium sp.]|jgi:flagellar basal-body rod modification protein FlgD